MLDSVIKRLYMYYKKDFAMNSQKYTQLIYKKETVKDGYFTIITKNESNWCTSRLSMASDCMVIGH